MSVRVIVNGPSPSGAASGSSPPYAAAANAASASAPTGSPGWYAERQIGTAGNDSATSASTSRWAATQPARHASPPPSGNTRLAITPSTR